MAQVSGWPGVSGSGSGSCGSLSTANCEKSAVRTADSWAMMKKPTSCVSPMLARVAAVPICVHVVPLLDQYADTWSPRRLSFSHFGTVLVPPATEALSWPLPSGSVRNSIPLARRHASMA